MVPQIIILTLAAIGIIETIYLIHKRVAHQVPICPIGTGCATVLESKYNKLFGVNNDVLGLLFYIIISFITVFLMIGIGPMAILGMLVKIIIGGGVIASLGLIFIQWQIVKAWCFWCIMSAITTFIMAAVILTNKLIFS